MSQTSPLQIQISEIEFLNLFDMCFFWCVLALRPSVISPPDLIDYNFSQWKQPFVQQALSQVILMLFR